MCEGSSRSLLLKMLDAGGLELYPSWWARDGISLSVAYRVEEFLAYLKTSNTSFWVLFHPQG